MRFRFNGDVRLFASAVLGAAILAAPARAEDIVIKMWTLDNNGYKEFIAEAAESFKTTHPNVSIEHQIFPGDPYKTALKVALVGSDGPDVFFNWAGDRATQLVKDKLALDITDYGDVPGGFAKVLPQGLLDSFRHDGRLYGVATDAVTKYVFYDKAYFAEHKLEIPKTLGELGGLCKAIRQIDPDTIPMPLGNKTRWKAIHWMTMLNERAMGVEATAADYDLSRPATSSTPTPATPRPSRRWSICRTLAASRMRRTPPNTPSPIPCSSPAPRRWNTAAAGAPRRSIRPASPTTASSACR